MDDIKVDKIIRVLSIYSKLLGGQLINKAEEANNFHVNERSIQRDIDDIRNFFDEDGKEKGWNNSVIYDYYSKGYRLEEVHNAKLSNGEVLAICKILIASQAFTKKEIKDILNKLIYYCVPKANQNMINSSIKNELFHYEESHHTSDFIDQLWNIGVAIRNNNYLKIEYDNDHKIIKRRLKPLAILFSNQYFYLVAYLGEDAEQDLVVTDDQLPMVYRMDRIKKYIILNDQFHISYASRFDEGEFRKNIQKMINDQKKVITFNYCGPDVNDILKQFPNAKIISKDQDLYLIRIEDYTKDIEVWLRRQTDRISNIHFID